MTIPKGGFYPKLRLRQLIFGFMKTKLFGIVLSTSALLVGVLGYLNQHAGLRLGRFIDNVLGDFYAIVTAELVGLAVVFYVFEVILEARLTGHEKNRLRMQLGSPDNLFAREAARLLKAHGWLTDGSLKGANLHLADLSEVDLQDASLSWVDLSAASLRAANLYRADLSKANLVRANLAMSGPIRANLRRAFLSGSDMSWSKLFRADLSGAYLIRTNLKGANLFRANLSGANLTRALLARANLRGANLSGANLGGANLYQADLTRANLSGARVTLKQLAQAQSLVGAIMPDGTRFDPQKHRLQGTV